MNKKGFIGITILFIITGSIVFLLLLIFSFFYGESKFHDEIDKNKEDIVLYMNQIDDNIEIINEDVIYYKDINIGSSEKYILTGKNKENEIINVEVDFRHHDKNEDYSIETDYIDNKVGKLILNNVFDNMSFEYPINNREEYNSLEVTYMSKEKIDHRGDAFRTLISLYSDEIINNSIKENVKVKHYIESNYKEILEEKEVDLIVISFIYNNNFYNNYLNDRINNEELNEEINKVFTMYESFKEIYPNLNLKIEINYDTYIKDINTNNIQEEKSKLINIIKENYEYMNSF